MNTSNPLKKSRLSHNQQGMVSIMVTMILMIVLSLIVLGFAQISRRNQRVTLDRQLSTQAFYAAESGINDALNAIKTAGTTEAKTTCGQAASGIYHTLNNSLSDPNNVSYSCLLVNPTPSNLLFNGVGNGGIVSPIISADGTNISSINLNWQSSTPNPLNNCQGALVPGSLLPATLTGWKCGFGVLRFDLVNVAGTQTANGYEANTMTTFAVPLTTGTNQVAFGANAHATVGVLCTATSCNLKVTGLSSNSYYIRASTIYNKASVLTITAYNAANTPIPLSGAQALIDATGKAQDVLRRIQVRVPFNGAQSANQLPTDALSSTDSLCKRFSIMDGWSSNTPTGVTGTNALCQP